MWGRPCYAELPARGVGEGVCTRPRHQALSPPQEEDESPASLTAPLMKQQQGAGADITRLCPPELLPAFPPPTLTAVFFAEPKPALSFRLGAQNYQADREKPDSLTHTLNYSYGRCAYSLGTFCTNYVWLQALLSQTEPKLLFSSLPP